MPNRTLSTSVDEKIASVVDDLVRIEGGSSSQLLAAALTLYLQLPEEAHRAFRVVESMGTEDERLRTRREVVRALLNGEYDVARRHVASRLGPPGILEDDEDLMDAAVGMLKAG